MNTPTRTVRVPDHVWHPAVALAADRGETVTTVILTALTAYLDDHSAG